MQQDAASRKMDYLRRGIEINFIDNYCLLLINDK